MRKKSKATLLLLLSALITAIMLAATPAQAQTGESILSDDWQFDAQIYIWAADFGGELNNGTSLSLIHISEPTRPY